MTTTHHGHSHSHSHPAARSVEPLSLPNGLSAEGGANQRQMRKETPNGLRVHGHSHSHTVERYGDHDHEHHDTNLRHYKSNTQLSQQNFLAPLDGTNNTKRMPISVDPPAPRAYSDSNGYGFPSIAGAISPPAITTTAHGMSERRPWISAQEALNSILLPLPLLLTTLAFSSHAPGSHLAPAEPAFSHLSKSETGKDSSARDTQPRSNTSPGFAEACALASATLILIGCVGKVYYRNASLDRRRDNLGIGAHRHKKQIMILSAGGVERVVRRALSVGLPFYAALKLSGDRTAMVLLTVLAGSLSKSDGASGNITSLEGWRRLLSSRGYVIGILIVGIACDILGFTMSVDLMSLVLGYMSLFFSTVFLPLPFRSSISTASPISPVAPSASSTSAVPATPWGQPPDIAAPLRLVNKVSPLISTAQSTNITLATGVVLLILSSVAHLLSFSSNLEYSLLHWILFIAAAAAAALMLLLAQPSSLQTEKKAGFVLGITFTSILSIVSLGDSWLEGSIQCILGLLSYLAIQIDTSSAHHPDQHSHHRHHGHQHGEKTKGAVGHDHAHRSTATNTLLRMTQQWPLAHSILIEKDSRRIFYFMILNFSFMLVQTFYGVATGSLGLLSDSIHMLFDCLALVVGLCAAVMSKWPPSMRFPYGLGKMDTLAGFANGIFLMLISIEIVVEAIERLVEGSEMKRIGELLTVSSLGLVVNLVGLFAFDHAHHGHGHSHGGHSHGHSHSHSHSHEAHDHDHDHDHGHDHSSHAHDHFHGSPSKAHSHGHGHHHSNENMHGIFLHVLADTLGSVAVVISTLLIQWFGWAGFDPLASCLIAILIFASAIPLVASSAKTLLLTIPADTEYHLRETLAGLSGLRSVVGYCVPRFWLEDATGAADAHGPGCEDAAAKGGDGSPRVLGMIHVIVSRGADFNDAKGRVMTFLKNNGLDVVVQFEREGEGRCWCGGGGSSKIGG